MERVREEIEHDNLLEFKKEFYQKYGYVEEENGELGNGRNQEKE